MVSFSTDDLRPQDRFDHWCEVGGKSLFGVMVELERERRTHFQGRFSAVAIGNAVLAEMTASSYSVSRTTADIAFACGFDSIATFYRVFRSAYGMTPGHVRIDSLNA